jgi:peroxiredoxin Q/BCP
MIAQIFYTSDMQLHVGDDAPQFTLPDQNGTMHSLSDFGGLWVLLFFYPKDNTPGCTTEACGIRDSFEAYRTAGVVVLGVSVDSVKSHKKFEEKYQLPFMLLSDSLTEVVAKYDVWHKKKFMGKEYMGIVRTSFLISPQGRIAYIFENVDVKVHAQEILSKHKELLL